MRRREAPFGDAFQTEFFIIMYFKFCFEFFALARDVRAFYETSAGICLH